MDLSGTFKFSAAPHLDSIDRQKAEYTFFEVLNLNETPREFLRQAREDAFEDYKARLERYNNEKSGNNDQVKLNKMVDGIK